MQQCPFILLYLHDFHPEIEQQQNPQLATMQPYSVSKKSPSLSKIQIVLLGSGCFRQFNLISLLSTSLCTAQLL